MSTDFGMFDGIRCFSRRELDVASSGGVWNYTDPRAARVLLLWADALRRRLQYPLKVTSALRSVEDNRRVGGAPGSAHLDGLALDLAPMMVGAIYKCPINCIYQLTDFRGEPYHPERALHRVIGCTVQVHRWSKVYREHIHLHVRWVPADLAPDEAFDLERVA